MSRIRPWSEPGPRFSPRWTKHWSQLEQLAKWLDTEPEVPEGQDPIETFLLAGQHAKGARVS